MNNKFPEILISENEIFKDSRGFFFEAWSKSNFIIDDDKVIGDFAQTNISFSKKGVLRGIHFQEFPYEQAKLIQVLSGKIYDVAVDLRKDSPTFGQWAATNLDINKQLYLPAGFGHGFVALEDSIVMYNVTNLYNKSAERTIIWNDIDLNIDWPVVYPIMSEKDKAGIKLKDL